MDRETIGKHTNQIAGVFVILGLMTILIANLAFAHGGMSGKKHGSGSFTRLQAIQKAIGLYDQLIVKRKIEERWETELKTVEVSQRESKGVKELVVSFKRYRGNPDTVYFFFKPDGEYTGSNFSGK